jgi:hypothetical protein
VSTHWSAKFLAALMRGEQGLSERVFIGHVIDLITG